MGHHWHPAVGPDSGVDGEIELVDPHSGAVQNFRIGVQSKATEGVWRSETAKGFLYRPKPDDLDYWLGSNQPVLLVCSRPKSDEAYFRDVSAWAKDPARRSSGLIDFDKRQDRFDQAARARLFDLEAREPVKLEPPGPLPEPEQALTNLLPVVWEADCLWTVEAPPGPPGEIFDRAREAGAWRSSIVLRAGRLWSLSPFDDPFLDAIGVAGDVAPLELGPLTRADSRDHERLLAELARRTLMRQHRQQLRWSSQTRAAHFRLWEETPERAFKWGRGKGRTVVKPRSSLGHEGLSGYRHDAAHLRFRRLATGWVLSIEPTYVFTSDGAQLSSFHAAALKKMKEMDRAAAVSQQLRMWATLFAAPATVMDTTPPPLSFGPLIPVTIPVKPPEKAWAKPPRGSEPAEGDADHMALFDVGDLAA